MRFQSDQSKASIAINTVTVLVKNNQQRLNPTEFNQFARCNITIANHGSRIQILDHYYFIADLAKNTAANTPENGLYLTLYRHFRQHCVSRGFDLSTESLVSQNQAIASPCA